MAVVATYASSRTNQIGTSELFIKSYDFDPDATTATDIAWVDMAKYEYIVMSFCRTVGVSDLTMKVIANTDSDGGGTDDYVIKAVTLAAQPDAVGDNVFVEVHADEIAHAAAKAGVALRYVSLSLAVATGTDEGICTYVAKAKNAAEDTTADAVSA